MQPISSELLGLYRDIALSAQIAAILFAMQFSLIIFNEWRNQRTRSWNDTRVGWGTFLMLAAIHLIFFTIADFYSAGNIFDALPATPIERIFWLRLGYITLQVGLLVLSLAVNRILSNRAFHFFSVLSIAAIVLSLVLPHDILRIVALLVIAPAIIVELLAFTYFAVKTIKGRMRSAVGVFFLSFIAVIGGYGFTADFAIQALGQVSYTIGAIVIAAGCIIMGTTLPNITDFDEFNWWTAVRELYIVTRGGVGLLSVNLSEERASTMDTDSLLTSGGITGIREVLKRIIGTEEELQIVDHGTMKILFAYSKHVVGVLLVTKPLETLFEKLTSFVERFEVLFAGLLEDFDGKVSVFAPAHRLALAEFTRTQEVARRKVVGA
ncbi:MAG: hypothetical protein ACFFCO_03370 [Promethearchaeota archaeon]